MIDAADEDEIGRSKSGGNKTSLSNPSTSKKSIGAGYLTFRGAKRGGGNTEKGFKAARGSEYLISDTKKAFNHLRHAFTKALILQHFDPEWHIPIESNVLGYAIGGVLSLLTLNDLSQWHLVAYYLYKMILAKTRYKTHDNKLLPIVEAFTKWQHYLKTCKHKVFVLTNYNNFCRLMNI